MIALADADQSAADIAGLSTRLSPERQFARRLAEKGYVVYAPFFTERRAFSEPWSNDRSWLFRLAYQTGHHLLGSEVQQVAAAREYLESLPSVERAKIALAGSGREACWRCTPLPSNRASRQPGSAATLSDGSSFPEEPEDRIIWNITRFGDAGVASLAAPCRLLIEGGLPGAEREFARISGDHARLLKAGSSLDALDAALGFAPSREGMEAW